MAQKGILDGLCTNSGTIISVPRSRTKILVASGLSYTHVRISYIVHKQTKSLQSGSHMFLNVRDELGPVPVTQKLIRVKIDPAGSLLVAIIDPAGSLLAAKSDPPLQKVIRVQILVDSSLF